VLAVGILANGVKQSSLRNMRLLRDLVSRNDANKQSPHANSGEIMVTIKLLK